jgi:hypothetical protein
VGLGVCLEPAGVKQSHPTTWIVLRSVSPAQPRIDMHIALA